MSLRASPWATFSAATTFDLKRCQNSMKEKLPAACGSSAMSVTDVAEPDVAARHRLPGEEIEGARPHGTELLKQ